MRIDSRPSVGGRIRSGIASRMHRPSRLLHSPASTPKDSSDSHDDYDLTYRRPLLADDYADGWGAQKHRWVTSSDAVEEEDGNGFRGADDFEVDDEEDQGGAGSSATRFHFAEPATRGRVIWKNSPRHGAHPSNSPGNNFFGANAAASPRTPRTPRTPRSPRTPTNAAPAGKYGSKKTALRPVRALKSALGRNHQQPRPQPYHSDYYDDEMESRDDDAYRYLLRSAMLDAGAASSDDFTTTDATNATGITEASNKPSLGFGNKKGKFAPRSVEGMRSFKQLRLQEEFFGPGGDEGSPGTLRVVDLGGFDSEDDEDGISEDDGSSIASEEGEKDWEGVGNSAGVIVSEKGGPMRDDSSSEKENKMKSSTVASSTVVGCADNADVEEEDDEEEDGSSEVGARGAESSTQISCDFHPEERARMSLESLRGLEIDPTPRPAGDDGGYRNMLSRMNSANSTLIGLNFASGQYSSSNFEYITSSGSDTKTDGPTPEDEHEAEAGSVTSEASSATVDFDHEAGEDTHSDVLPMTPVAAMSPRGLYRSPHEQSTVATDDDGGRTYVTYATYATRKRASPMPVMVTPTENGDVILMTPMEDVMDVGPQPMSTHSIDEPPSPYTPMGDVVSKARERELPVVDELFSPTEEDAVEAGTEHGASERSTMAAAAAAGRPPESPRTRSSPSVPTTTPVAGKPSSPYSVVMEDVVDIGPQPSGSSAARSAASRLLIPSLGEGNLPEEDDARQDANHGAHHGGANRHESSLEKSGSGEETSSRASSEGSRSVDASRIKTVMRRRVVLWEDKAVTADKEVSPTGVDDLLGEENAVQPSKEGIQGTNQRKVAALVFDSKPPLARPPVSREDSEFIASDDWIDGMGNSGTFDRDDDSFGAGSFSSQPFGPCMVNEDVVRDLRGGREAEDRHNVIELRPSLESDCDQGSSIESCAVGGPASDFSDVVTEKTPAREKPPQSPSSLNQANRQGPNEVMEMNFDHSVEDTVMDDHSKESKETCASMGSFSQIFTRGSPRPDDEDEEESDSESDAPGDYFDYSNEDVVLAPDGLAAGVLSPGVSSSAASSNASFEGATLLRKTLAQDKEGTNGEESTMEKSHERSKVDVQENYMLPKTSQHPWANNNDSAESVSDCAPSDLISVPSASMASSSSLEEEESPLTPHFVPEKQQAHNETASSSNGNARNFDILNNFWFQEWKEMAAAGEASERSQSLLTVIDGQNLSDPDREQPRFMLKKEVGNTMTEKEAQSPGTRDLADDYDNICKDCDGNEYLKIVDLDSGAETYEVLQRSYELETVEECSSEEEADEDGRSYYTPLESLSGEKPTESLSAVAAFTGLDGLWSKIDQYQATLQHGTTPVRLLTSSPGLLQYRSVKSTKRRFVRVKKRAIVKARKASDRTKFDLGHLEKGSQSHRRSLSGSPPKARSASAIMEARIFEALTPSHGGQSNTSRKSSEAVQIEDLDQVFAISESARENDETDHFGYTQMNHDNQSSASSGLSVEDSFDSWHVDSDSEGGDKANDAKAGKNKKSKESASGEKEEKADSSKGKSPEKPRPGLKRWDSMKVSNLYHENLDLAETLAATQSELEKVNRKLAQITIERDEILATARFEI